MTDIHGVVPPVVTPFEETGEVDADALREEIRYHLDSGVNGVSVAGSTGEGNALSVDEHEEVYGVAVDEVDGSVPVVAGVIATSAREAAAKAERARDAGADAVMATPPHYERPTDDGLVDYFAAVGDAGGLPILIYDVIEKVDVTADLATRIADDVPELYGIKQSGGDMHGLANMLTAVGDELTVLTALDDLLFPSYVLGAVGTIGGVTSIYPRVSVDLWEAVQDGDIDRARTIHEATLPLARAAVWDRDGNYPGGVKAAIELLGRNPGHPRSPIVDSSGADRERIADAVAAMRDRGVYERPENR
ncbi:dihydrodipicolinate synthase family protein [Halorarum halophilum]|uniref:Dihydrodipicolinate synthase family protein n=1 Tax=Halorarum halophilum TaxID=2743090 RepID=A0A7D5KWV4_9EURY|nr:dihydrodipicolinate synthase family protein [Halobaculum halophilum]QLG27278.1 dihydrodipicolinate synthase family protein [Halobaculum halophilum]